MSNLIVTIISILLVAVMAVMAIWYGGPAFQAAQAKATSNAILSHLKQQAKAMKLWTLDNAGTIPVPQSGIPVNAGGANTFQTSHLASFLSPQYIQSSGIRAFFFRPVGVENGVLRHHSFNGAVITKEICQHIDGLRTGNTDTIRVASNSQNWNVRLCGQFGCFDKGDIPGLTGTYQFYYRVYGRPDTDSPDCP